MKRAEEMTHLMETVESQQQAAHSFPQALGNLVQSARFPHFLSSPLRRVYVQTQTCFFASLRRTLTDSEVEWPVLSAGLEHNTYLQVLPVPVSYILI
jgi:hypothetical protein